MIKRFCQRECPHPTSFIHKGNVPDLSVLNDLLRVCSGASSSSTCGLGTNSPLAIMEFPGSTPACHWSLHWIKIIKGRKLNNVKKMHFWTDLHNLRSLIFSCRADTRRPRMKNNVLSQSQPHESRGLPFLFSRGIRCYLASVTPLLDDKRLSHSSQVCEPS